MVYIEDDFADGDSVVYRVYKNRTFFGRYDRYTVPSFILLLFGLTVGGITIADVAYTAIHFGPNCDATGAPSPLRPCSGTHWYTYVSSGIWGGLVIVVNGIFGLYVPSWTVSYTWVFTGYAALAIVNTFGVVPTIAVLNILEITQNNGTFYVSDNMMQIGVCWDLVKVILPIAIAGIALLTEIVLFIIMAVIICCRHSRHRPRFYDEPTYYRRGGSYESRDRDYVRPRDRGDSFWNYGRSDDVTPPPRRRRSFVRSRDYADDYPRRLVPAGPPNQILYPPLRNANNTPVSPSPYYGAGAVGAAGAMGAAGAVGPSRGFVGPFGRGGNLVRGPYGGEFPRPVITTNPYGFYRSSAFNQPQVMGMAPFGRFA